MTIDEAIINQKEMLKWHYAEGLRAMRKYQTGRINKEDHNEAQTRINKQRLTTQLGIEALERLRDSRNGVDKRKYHELLPSETEE